MRLILNVLLGVTLLFSLPVRSDASQELEKKYLDAYQLVRQAFEDKNRGNSRLALQKFQTAKQILWEIKSEKPNWHVQTIQYLNRDCEQQIQNLYQGESGREEVRSEERVDQLIGQIVNIQKNRDVARSNPRAQVAEKPRKSSKIPSLTSLIKGRENKKEPARPSPKPIPASYAKKSKSIIYGDSRMLAEKVEALESAFMTKKKEADQWRLQYSILEGKAREEIQSLSSEYAKEKTDLEVQISALKNDINKEQQGFKKLKQEVQQKKALEQSIQKSTVRIQDLERALEEAQAIRSKAQEEAKILEGQVVLNLKEEFQQSRSKIVEQLNSQKEQYEQKIATLKEQVAQSENQIKNIEREVASKKSGQLAEKNQQIALLEDKVLKAVQEKALLVRNTEGIQEKQIEKIESIQKALEEYKAREVVLKEELQSQKSQIASLDKSQSTSKDLDSQLSRMQSRLKFKDKIIHELEEKVAKSEKMIQKQKNTFAGLRNQLKVKEEQKDGSQEIINEQKKVIVSLENKNKEVNSVLSNLETKIAKYDEEKEYFLNQDKEFEVTKKNFEVEKMDWKRRLARLEQELNKTRSELARKDGSVRTALLEADGRLAEIKSENEQTIMDLLESFKREKKSWNLEVAKLNEKLTERGDDAQLLASVKRAENELAEALENNKGLQQEVADLKEEISLVRVQKESADPSEKEKLFAEIQEKEVVNQQQDQKIAASQKRVQELRDLVENSENEKKSLYEEVNQLNTMVVQLRLDLKRTDDINTQLRDSVSQIQLRTPTSFVASTKSVEKAPVKIVQAPIKDLRKREALTEQDVKNVIQNVKNLFRQRKYNDALAVLQQQLEIYPSNDRFMFYQGLTFSRLKQVDKAIDAYEKTVRVNPKMAKAYNNLGNLYSQQKRYGKAIENLKKATQLNGELSEAFNNMGIVYSHLGQFDESIKAFIRATDINPKLVAAYYNLGQIYYHDQKWDAAVTSFEKVLSLAPDHVEAKDYLAQITNDKKSNKTRLALEPEID